MLSYRHGFHAGNWADLHKHAALALLISHLRRKEKAFCVIDAFAGDGMYDLRSATAQKTGEYRNGIEPVWRRTDAPPGIASLLDSVRDFNPAGELAAYPGSPALIRAAMRAHDRLILGELHPAAHASLGRWASGDRRISVHRRDALEMVQALVPPKERRGLVFVDPAYEVKDEYTGVPAAIGRALKKWPGGIYAIWYPVLEQGRHAALIAALASMPASAILHSLLTPAEPPTRMRAAGVVVLNPPWKFDLELTVAADWIAGALWPSRPARHDMAWLKPPAADKT